MRIYMVSLPRPDRASEIEFSGELIRAGFHFTFGLNPTASFTLSHLSPADIKVLLMLASAVGAEVREFDSVNLTHNVIRSP